VVEYHLSDLFADQPPLDELRIANVESAAEERMAALRLPGKVHRHVAIGRPAGQLVELATRLKPALLVVGTRGLSGLSGMVLGSVAEHVVRHAPCPVVCIKAGP
jgi:universal stress protein A